MQESIVVRVRILVRFGGEWEGGGGVGGGGGGGGGGANQFGAASC